MTSRTTSLPSKDIVLTTGLATALTVFLPLDSSSLPIVCLHAGGRRDQSRRHVPHKVELLLVDGVTHCGEQPQRYHATQRAEDLGRVCRALLGDVRIDIATAEENRLRVEGARVVPRGRVRADQATAQPHEPAVPPSIAGRELQSQTGAL